jgi:aminoglycoside phosphotransferase family enzyme
MADDPLVAESRARVAALRAQLESREGAPVRLIETHVSWVLLARELAYKIKKPVRLPFLDFSCLAERRRSCDEELRLNAASRPICTSTLSRCAKGRPGRASRAPAR